MNEKNERIAELELRLVKMEDMGPGGPYSAEEVGVSDKEDLLCHLCLVAYDRRVLAVGEYDAGDGTSFGACEKHYQGAVEARMITRRYDKTEEVSGWVRK